MIKDMTWDSTIYNMSKKEDFVDLKKFFNEKLSPAFDTKWGYRYVRVESTKEMINLTMLIYCSYLVINDLKNLEPKQASGELIQAKTILDKLQRLNSEQESEYIAKSKEVWINTLKVGKFYHENSTRPTIDECLKRLDFQLSLTPEPVKPKSRFFTFLSDVKQATIKCCTHPETN